MQTLIKFQNFVQELSMDSGRNYKISVLEKYKDDSDIKQYLYFLLNPYITTGVSDKKIQRLQKFNLDKTITITEATVFNMLDYIRRYNTGADNFLETLKDFTDRILPVVYHNLFFKIISKNLPLGIDAKTVNKVMPGLIPTFNVQLANKYFDKPEVVGGKTFALTTKIDGGRIIAIKKNGNVKFYTRQGQEYEGLVDLKQEMENYMPDNLCLDGEITLLDKGALTSKEQYKETMKLTRKDGEKHGVKMLVFDCMTADEFESQSCQFDYSKRRIFLNQIFKPIENASLLNSGNWQQVVLQCGGTYYGSEYQFKYFDLLPILYVGTDTSEITKWLNYNIEHGEEGVMINIWDAPYDFKRTNNLLKVKKMQDLDLEVVGFEEGTNRHTGRLGALLVEYKGNIVKVGSGFSDELRTSIWTNKDEWLGRTVVVQYFEETTNDNGGISLRFPVYLDYRTDK